MSLRMGVTFAEEQKMKKLVAAGASWSEIAAQLEDCDLDYVKKNLYEPLKAKADAALAEDTK